METCRWRVTNQIRYSANHCQELSSWSSHTVWRIVGERSVDRTGLKDTAKAFYVTAGCRRKPLLENVVYFTLRMGGEAEPSLCRLPGFLLPLVRLVRTAFATQFAEHSDRGGPILHADVTLQRELFKCLSILRRRRVHDHFEGRI